MPVPDRIAERFTDPIRLARIAASGAKSSSTVSSAVPVNRMGYFQYQFTPAQLKIIREVITQAVFAAVALIVLQQPLRWNYVVSFGFLIAAVVAIFL
jgi:uncharacterized protein (DUF486 family)